MKTIRESIEIDMDAETVFALTQDYDVRLEWDPYLVEAYLMGGKNSVELGALSYCKNKNGSFMISKYISYNPPKVAAISMTQGPFLLKKFSGAWNVTALTDSKSLLVFTYNFELIGGVIGKLFLPIASYLFSRDMKARLVCFKDFAEKSQINAANDTYQNNDAQTGV